MLAANSMDDRVVWTVCRNIKKVNPAVMTAVVVSEIDSSGVTGSACFVRVHQTAKTCEPGRPRRVPDAIGTQKHRNSKRISDRIV